MKRLRHLSLSLGFVFLFTSVTVRADDLLSPGWRGQYGTTYARWDFSTAPTPGGNYFAEAYFNPWHERPTVLPSPTVWHGLWGGRQGVVATPGLDFATYHYPPMGATQDFWVQITWAPQSPGASLHFTPRLANVTLNELVQTVLLEPTGAPASFGEQWVHSTYHVSVYPNTDWARLDIWGDIMVDQFIVDTIIPEPSLMAFGFLGGLVFVWRRRHTD